MANQSMQAAYKELTMREAAAAHLTGIPARQNATEIARLYDRLVDMNIQQIEAEHGA